MAYVLFALGVIATVAGIGVALIVLALSESTEE